MYVVCIYNISCTAYGIQYTPNIYIYMYIKHTTCLKHILQINPYWLYMVGDDTRTMALDCNFTGFQVCGLEVLGSGTWSPDPNRKG